MYVYNSFRRYKLNIEGSRIYDPIRRKYVALTPEERVRQQTIQYLLKRLKVPADRIGVERSLSALGDPGNRKRVDLCIFGKRDEILAVIECKAAAIDGWDDPFVQAIGYVEELKVRNFFVVDGYEMQGYHYCAERFQFDPIEDIPDYEAMLAL